LICSLTYTGAFNPEQACIAINPPDEISLSKKCREGCILCTQYCGFGAIVKAKEVTTMGIKEG
jgi:flavoprotein